LKAKQLQIAARDSYADSTRYGYEFFTPACIRV
jgi:hypothetical protein